MKMVKSLLLGAAAGLVAMTGAQAADLPVKAKPVQYVKICSLYGAGFYYIPGTDMCLKVGGWVRSQMMYNANANLTNGPLVSNTQSRATGNYAFRVRGYITADARNQSEYGTIRSYIAVGLDTTNGGGNTFSSNRAFIQFAGFTFGLSQSFYDLYSGPAMSLYGGKINPSSDTGDGGAWVTGYTAQFGNGLSASLAVEQPRNITVINAAAALNTNALTTTAQKGQNMPDLVANLRVDQAWGSAQVMGGIHDVSGQYYGAPMSTANGNPSDKLGWALGAGLKLNAPMIGAGDWFQAQVNYTQGAAGYTNAGTAIMYSVFDGGTGGKYSYGLMSDSVYGTGTDIQLTTAWNVNAGFEHFWNKSWQTALYGQYSKTSYNSTANAMLCAQTGIFTGVLPTPAAGCNNNWSLWTTGLRNQWNLDSSTWLAVDVMYAKLNTASSGLTTSVAGFAPQPTAVRTMGDVGEWMVQFQVRRNFYP